MVAPDDVPAHPYKVAMEVASLAPNAEVTIYPWKVRKSRSTRSWSTRGASSRRTNPSQPGVNDESSLDERRREKALS